MKFRALLIPDCGDTIVTRSWPNAMDCRSHARAEAKLHFRRVSAVTVIEIVILEGPDPIEHFLEKRRTP